VEPMLEYVTQSSSYSVDKNENVILLRRMLSHLLELQSSGMISSFDRNRIKKSIIALRAGIDALQTVVSA